MGIDRDDDHYILCRGGEEAKGRRGRESPMASSGSVCVMDVSKLK
jgi:hypothetical protein